MNGTIKAEYNGYTGYAYGVSSFSIRDKDNHEILHTGFCTERPQTEAECLEYLKDTLDLLDTLKSE